MPSTTAYPLKKISREHPKDTLVFFLPYLLFVPLFLLQFLLQGCCFGELKNNNISYSPPFLAHAQEELQAGNCLKKVALVAHHV